MRVMEIIGVNELFIVGVASWVARGAGNNG